MRPKKQSLSLFLICVGCAPIAVPSVTSLSVTPTPFISPSAQPSNSPDVETLTHKKAFELGVPTNMTAPGVKGQLTLSLKGRPTAVKYVPLPIITPSEETYGFTLPAEAPEFLELPSKWDTQTVYKLPEQIPEH